jgi:hypothetical protein
VCVYRCDRKSCDFSVIEVFANLESSMRTILPQDRDPLRRASHPAMSFADRRRPNLWTQIQPLHTAIYLMGGMVSIAWVFYVIGFSLAAWLTLAAIPIVLPQASLQLYCRAEVAWNRSGFGRTISFGTVLSIVGVSLLTFTLATAQPEAAHAQFFKKAEEYVKSKLAASAPGADKAVELIFIVLRGLFLIYLGIAIVRIVQASRNDQDWQDLARTPLIILIAVVLGDVLSGFIIGGA